MKFKTKHFCTFFVPIKLLDLIYYYTFHQRKLEFNIKLKEIYDICYVLLRRGA